MDSVTGFFILPAFIQDKVSLHSHVGLELLLVLSAAGVLPWATTFEVLFSSIWRFLQNIFPYCCGDPPTSLFSKVDLIILANAF